MTRVRHADRFTLHPSTNGAIRVRCGHDECGWIVTMYPTRMDAIIIPVVLDDVLETVNLHNGKEH